MVRLKVYENESSGSNSYSFQFQYGAIKGIMTLSMKLKPMDFNSNMVRLKATLLGDLPSPGTHFNSNMVRLKVR